MRYATPACPLDAGHGRLVDWPGARTAWYCPSRRHEGEVAFYDSELVPVPRTARDGTVPPASRAAFGAGPGPKRRASS